MKDQIKPTSEKLTLDSYPVFDLEQGVQLPEADQIVRDQENIFAPKSDEVQHATPSMQYVNETDMKLLSQWIGDPSGKLILEAGPGTGRTTIPLAKAVGPTGKVFCIETASEYYKVMREKTVLDQTPPNQLKLGLADIQSLESEQVAQFLNQEQVDFVTFWFGPLALMPTDPQKALQNCVDNLKPGGEVLISSNSLGGLAYTVPEQAIKDGADPELPLGYQPGIFTRRVFNDSNTPTGMVLDSGETLPAIYYSPDQMTNLLKLVGLKLIDMTGISRLTGLYPAKPDQDSIDKFINLVQQIDSEYGELMWKQSLNFETVWNLAQIADGVMTDTNIDEYTYPAYRAIKLG